MYFSSWFSIFIQLAGITSDGELPELVLARCQFHQQFMQSHFVRIESRFLCLQFIQVFFGESKFSKKLLTKCRRNWSYNWHLQLSQCHQFLTSSFSFCQKNTNTNCTCKHQKSYNNTFIWKCWCLSVGEIGWRGQFHQHYKSIFYTRRSQKCKKTLVTWQSLCTFGIFECKNFE